MDIKHKPFSLKFILFCVLVITLILSVVYVILYVNAKSVIENQLGINAQSVAVSVSLDIMENIDDYKTFIETKDIDSAYYKKMHSKFGIIKAESDIKYIFTERRIDSETIEFILDSEPIGSAEYSPPGSTGPNDWKRETVYSSGEPAKFKVYDHPQWGKIIAAYAPLFDENGEMLGIIGINIDSTELFKQLENIFRIMIITYIVIILAATALLVKYSNLIIELAGRLSNSQKAAEQSAISLNVIKTLMDALDTYLFVAELETDKIIFVNAKMKEYFHLGNDAVGQPCYEVMNSCTKERCDFCVKHRLLNASEDAETLDTQVEINGVYYKKADRIIEWYDGRKVHLQYFVDVSELKQAEAELKIQLAQLQRMSALINAAQQSISYIKPDGKFEFFNPATCDLSGYSPQELSAGDAFMFYDNQTKRHITDVILPAINAQGKYEYELPLIRKDGAVRTMRYSAFAIGEQEKDRGCIISDVTELKQLERELVEAKEKAEQIINTAPVAYGLSVDGVVLEVNEYARKYLGMKPGDKTTQFYTNPEERDLLFARAEAEHTIVSGILRLNMPDKGNHRFFINYSVLKLGSKEAVILWAVDVEFNELQKDQLRLAQESLQTLLDMMPVTIRILDMEDETLIYGNKAACKLYGVDSPDSIYGHRVDALMPEIQLDGTNSVERLRALNMSTEPTSMEMVFRKATGEDFEALISVFMIDYKGRKASVGIIQDLSAEKEYANMLRNTAEKEKEANRAKSEFLSRMSHEIRTPMNAIIGMTTIAYNSKESDKIRQCLDKINTASKHLLGVINDILDMSKIEASKFELSYDVFDFNNMIKNIVSIVNFRMESKQQVLNINIDEDVPALIISDEQRLSQVITNLLSNATKFTPDYGIIRMNARKIGEQKDICTIQIEVEDSGIGIAPEHQSGIFNSFEQAGGNISRKYGGTGLGLAISKRIVELMGGSIWVESEVGNGSKFIFTFKATKDNGQLSDISQTDSTASNNDFSNHTILLAEDVEINSEIIESILQNTGIVIDIVTNGLEAVKSFQKSSNRYSLILMDINMPEMGGYEATQHIRALDCEKAKTIPIIAMTADVFKEDVERCLAAGMNDHIGKPVDINELFAKMNKYLQ